MTTALVVEGSPPAQVDLAADLAAVGIHVLGATTRDALVRDAAQHAPDVVVCHDLSPGESLFAAFALLAESAPRPAIVFTQDPDVGKIERAVHSRIQSYVVNGYAQNRLRAVLHVACARFDEEQRLRGELAAVSRRFDERKLVDRAKGILMRARQLSEDEAFGVLRAASMHSNRRVGQVSEQVIAAAHYADAVNRAGKLRMLSQRLVKASALRLAAGDAPALAQIEATRRQIDACIEALAKGVAQPTFGDLLEAISAAWRALGERVGAAPRAADLAELDRRAETLLGHADQLTRLLETGGLVTTLHILNVSGRQRMLSQRFAKEALLQMLLARAPVAAQPTPETERSGREPAPVAALFEQAMAHLRGAPLSTAEIRALLDAAERAWADLKRAARLLATAEGALALDRASESLLAIFEELTDRYERSMQVLMG